MSEKSATDNERAEHQLRAERVLEQALGNGPVLLQHAERFHPQRVAEHFVGIDGFLHQRLIKLQSEGLGIVGLCWSPEKAVLEFFTLNESEEESENV
jgi:hypothetical protein